MALQPVPGQGLWIPDLSIYSNNPGAFSSVTIDATGEKAAFVGRVFNKDYTTKSVRTVGFAFGTVVKAGGSALTVSLQDVDLANGAPIRPDETQDQTVAIANGDAGFTSNAWYNTGNLSADRSVAFGELLAVVVEFDGGGRLGADTVDIRHGFRALSSGNDVLLSKVGAGPSWTMPGSHSRPDVLLGFSDGTFGTLSDGAPASARNFHTYKQDTGTADEYALRFQVPWPCKVDGVQAIVNPVANTSNFDFVLYDGTTAMTNGTISVDANAVTQNNTARLYRSYFSAAIELEANHTYYLAVKPTQTTSNITLTYFDVASADHLQAHPGGSQWYQGARLDLGSWTDLTTRRPLMGFRVSHLSDGAGGGAGPLIGPGRLVRS